MAHWTDRNPPKPFHPIAFGAAVLIIIGLALIALAPFAGANNPPPPTPNQYEFWCGANGVKLEPVATPFVIPDPPPGLVWTLLVLKAGSGEGENEQFANVVVGDSYVRTDGKDISHVILCYGLATTTTATTVGDDPPTTTSSTTTTTVATTTTTAPTTTSCPDCTPGQQTVPTTVGTTTTQAPCLSCRQVDTVPPTTVTVPFTVAPTTTATTLAPTTAPPVTTTPTVAPTTAPAAVPANDVLPVTGGSPWWLALFGVCLCALGGLAVLWVRS